MGIYVANKLAASQGDVDGGLAIVPNELGPTRYNAALVDDNGTAFAAAVDAAALADAASRSDHSGETASAADSLAIPITAPLCLKTTGADAEALTLADGTFIGQSVTVQLDVDGGGDGTLTPATSTSFGTVVFADAGDAATFVWGGATTGWVITGAWGLSAQPVTTLA